MKKLYICVFLNLSMIYSYAQNHLVIYQKTTDINKNTDINNEEYLLFLNEKKTIFINYFGDNESNPVFYILNEKKLNSSEVILNDVSQEAFFIKNNSFSKDNLFTMDTYFQLDWKIIKNEVKNIGDYRCTKAIANFRGRQYIAWFTSQLPFEYGPWKFRGLPGIILSINDSLGIFKYEAVKIILNASINDQDILNKLSFVFPEEKKDYLNYKDYILLENNSIKSSRERILSNLPQGTVIKQQSGIRDFKIEKSFEWETE